MAGKQDGDHTDSPIRNTNNPTENSFRSLRTPAPETSNRNYDDGKTSDSPLNSLDSTGTSDATSFYSTTSSIDRPFGDLTISHDNNLYESTMVQKEQQRQFDVNRECNRKQTTAGGNPPYFDNEMSCDKKNLKITNINPDVFYGACNLLNIYRIKGNDWRGLAGRLGYNVTDVKIFEESKDKGGYAGAMLYDWGAKGHHYIEDVVKELKEMGRDDVVELFQREIEKMGDSCNCVDCGHIV